MNFNILWKECIVYTLDSWVYCLWISQGNLSRSGYESELPGYPRLTCKVKVKMGSKSKQLKEELATLPSPPNYDL